jgi:hypothetical protein
VRRIAISDIVVKFRRIKKRTVVYLLLVERCYHWRLLTQGSYISASLEPVPFPTSFPVRVSEYAL